MKYFINIEETINGEFEVEANSKAEAFKIARDKYYSGIFVNEPGCITSKQMAVAEANEDYIGWKEF